MEHKEATGRGEKDERDAMIAEKQVERMKREVEREVKRAEREAEREQRGETKLDIFIGYIF